MASVLCARNAQRRWTICFYNVFAVGKFGVKPFGASTDSNSPRQWMMCSWIGGFILAKPRPKVAKKYFDSLIFLVA
jgi:hypothetical protein